MSTFPSLIVDSSADTNRFKPLKPAIMKVKEQALGIESKINGSWRGSTRTITGETVEIEGKVKTTD